MRLPALALLCAIAVACSSADDSVDVAPVPTPAPAADRGDAAEPVDEVDGEPSGAAVRDDDALTLTIETPAESATFDEVVDDVGALDPFGRFVSCSGWRAVVGTYGVAVTDPGGPIEAVGLLTVASIDGPGTHDADVRVERADGSSVLATGTVTLGDDLRTGRFVAFDPDGGRYTGEFTCNSSRPPPEPAEGERVDVVALIRDGERERVVGLTVAGADAECRATSGGDSPAVLRVDGDARVGSITTFELTDTGRLTLRLRVGGVSYEFADVEVTLDPDGASGTFGASDPDGLAVDGAFRCR